MGKLVLVLICQSNILEIFAYIIGSELGSSMGLFFQHCSLAGVTQLCSSQCVCVFIIFLLLDLRIVRLLRIVSKSRCFTVLERLYVWQKVFYKSKCMFFVVKQQ